MKSIKEIDIENKRVLIRADLNVPIDDEGNVTDPNRIKQFLPTLKEVLDRSGKAIVMSHLGRPDGKSDPRYSLKPVAKAMEELLGKPVKLAPDCIGQEVEALVNEMGNGDVILLENLRFHKGEKENDAEFSSMLAKLGDVYINDAFATAHRAHTSIVGVAKHFSEKGCGLLLEKEIKYCSETLENPARPFCVILGGAKVKTKLKALINISTKADKIIIGGAMANTFLASQGIQMGKSLVERDYFGEAIKLIADLARRECTLYLPVDVVVGPNISEKGVGRPVPVQEIPADCMALDIGPATSILYKEAIQTCETIIWNGPMGMFEHEDYAAGTTDMIETLAQCHGMTVIGGGDTDAAIHKMQLAHKFDYISTGGGAFLALLEGKPLPGIEALQ
ncbi:MAG: phosphoglycerate kinase [Candidatus Dadabacteria bacterium]|nr:MAG: phosphoglycerate kinase [Candidatus Dadabacteria bacterium]